MQKNNCLFIPLNGGSGIGEIVRFFPLILIRPFCLPFDLCAHINRVSEKVLTSH